MKKSIKIGLALLLILSICLIISTSVFAEDFPDLSSKVAANSSELAGNVSGIMGKALYLVQIIGMGVAVIMLVVLAIKYISASPGDKAEIKKHAVVYVVGAVVLFGASGIVALIRNFATSEIK